MFSFDQKATSLLGKSHIPTLLGFFYNKLTKSALIIDTTWKIHERATLQALPPNLEVRIAHF